MEEISQQFKKRIAKGLGIGCVSKIENSKKFPCNTLEDFSKIDPSDYYKECDPIIQSFLEGLTPISHKPNQENAHHSEQMKKIKIWDVDKQFISPIGLSTNYILYKISGSRLVVDIVGSFSVD